MRGVKVILAVVAAVIIVAAALFVFRNPIAGFALRQAMAAQGLPNPGARVTALSVNHIRIEDVSSVQAGRLDAPLLRFDHVDVAFNLREAMSARRVSRVDLGPGAVRIDVQENGAMRAAGVPVGAGGGGSGGGLPFSALTVSDLEVTVWTPEGVASGAVDATYDIDGSGRIEATFSSEKAGLSGFVLENTAATVDIALAESGDVSVTAGYAGDIRSPHGQIREADFVVQGEGASWKDLAAGDWRAFRGRADLGVGEARLEARDAPVADALNAYADLLGGPFDVLELSGDLTLVADNGAVSVELGERALSVEADTGARFAIDAAMGEPLLVFEDMRAAIAGVLSVRGGDVSATATIDAYQTDDGGWYFNIPLRVGAIAAPSFALSDASAVLHGTAAADVIDFEVTASGEVLSASIGRFAISDAPGAITARGAYDRAMKSLVLQLPEGSCAMLDRISLKIAGQDMDASLNDARLCAGDGPLAAIRLEDNPTADFSGVVTAEGARYRLGQTRFVGGPPSIELDGRYVPAENRTTASGVAKGGSVVLNNLLRFDRADAVLDFALEKDGMTIRADATQIRMTEYGEDAKVAPIYARGGMILSGDIARFNYEALSEGAVVLGAGAGEHNIKTATGTASFDFNRLDFAPRGLQPDALAPVLKGIIGLTQGAAEGAARFSWDQDGIASRANLTFDDITFRGPGLTVTKTVGVNGDIAFSSLWPVATDGAQTVTVAGVDFGALQLEDGEIVFDMPGDSTLLVERAIFPWFGGRIGVRDAKAAFEGGNALAPLRVESVDLKQILDFVDVEGLSGAGVLNGDLPLVVENSRASFVGGRLSAEGPGRISYVGKAGAAAAAAGGDAQIAFDVLRDLRYDTLSVLIDGPLDGRLDFRINFEGTGEVSINRARGRVPVKYNITLDAALLELLNQANLSRNLELQIENAVRGSE